MTNSKERICFQCGSKPIDYIRERWNITDIDEYSSWNIAGWWICPICTDELNIDRLPGGN